MFAINDPYLGGTHHSDVRVIRPIFEFLNNDVKSNALGRRRPADRHEMITGVRSYLRSTQQQPEIVKRYFQADSVRYAA